MLYVSPKAMIAWLALGLRNGATLGVIAAEGCLFVLSTVHDAGQNPG